MPDTTLPNVERIAQRLGLHPDQKNGRLKKGEFFKLEVRIDREFQDDVLALFRPVEASPLPGDEARNLIINRAHSDLDDIINNHDPEVHHLHNRIWGRLRKMGLEVEIQATVPLREALEKEEQGHSRTIEQRDHAEEQADELASAIAEITGEDIGEHSSSNDPWRRAIHLAQDYMAERAAHPTKAESLEVENG